MIIKVTGIKELDAKLNNISRRQLPYAAMSALNKTAFQVRSDARQEMARIFDRPTSYALKSVVVNKADKKELVASVGIVDPKEFVGDISGGKVVARKKQVGGPPPAFARPQVFGGQRAFKPFEVRLQSLGILRKDQMVVPARGAWLDRHGVISYGELVKILSDLRAFHEAGFTMNRGKKSKGYYRNFRYFVMRRGGRAIGVWARTIASGNIQPILAFVSKASYSPRFNFYAVGERTIYARLRKNFREALRYAIKTAR